MLAMTGGLAMTFRFGCYEALTISGSYSLLILPNLPISSSWF